jgi:hypothetical protein
VDGAAEDKPQRRRQIDVGKVRPDFSGSGVGNEKNCHAPHGKHGHDLDSGHVVRDVVWNIHPDGKIRMRWKLRASRRDSGNVRSAHRDQWDAVSGLLAMMRMNMNKIYQCSV